MKRRARALHTVGDSFIDAAARATLFRGFPSRTLQHATDPFRLRTSAPSSLGSSFWSRAITPLVPSDAA